MDISRNRFDKKYNDDSSYHKSSKQIPVEINNCDHDQSIEIVNNTDTVQVEEALFPSGVKADLQKDIEKSNIGCYIGILLIMCYIQRILLRDPKNPSDHIVNSNL